MGRSDRQLAVRVLGQLRDIPNVVAEDLTIDLSNANLQGFDLHDLSLTNANLSGARMEGADLGEARMEGATLIGTRMEGAYLSRARMEGANLSWAHMEGANLFKAWMEQVNLGWAWMEGAYLFEAHMEGANLFGAQMDASTSFLPASLRDAGLKAIDFTALSLDDETWNRLEALLPETFGDSTVTLPQSLVRPNHWPDAALDYFDEFLPQWHAFQA